LHNLAITQNASCVNSL